MKIVANRKMYFLISIGIVMVGLIFMVGNMAMGNGAFNYGVEFTGGTEFVVDIGKDVDNQEIIDIVVETTGQETAHVQKIVGTTQVSIKVQSLDSATRAELTTALKDEYGITDDVISINDISATVSEEMRTTAVLAIFTACVAMLIYVSIRFKDVKTGGSAIVALLHDTIIVTLSYAVFRIPLDYAFIAVILTILGYSINATIVIFDRIRENKNIEKKMSLEELIDLSINQTMRRCIYTSLTVLIVTFCLFIFGDTAIKNFTLPIMIGVICGTYSSIFVSGNLWYVFAGKSTWAQEKVQQ